MNKNRPALFCSFTTTVLTRHSPSSSFFPSFYRAQTLYHTPLLSSENFIVSFNRRCQAKFFIVVSTICRDFKIPEKICKGGIIEACDFSREIYANKYVRRRSRHRADSIQSKWLKNRPERTVGHVWLHATWRAMVRAWKPGGAWKQGWDKQFSGTPRFQPAIDFQND